MLKTPQKSQKIEKLIFISDTKGEKQTKKQKKRLSFVSFRLVAANHRFFGWRAFQLFSAADAAVEVEVELLSLDAARANEPTTKTGSKEAFLIGSVASNIILNDNDVADVGNDNDSDSISSRSSASLMIIMTYTVGLHFTSTRAFTLNERVCACGCVCRCASACSR